MQNQIDIVELKSECMRNENLSEDVKTVGANRIGELTEGATYFTQIQFSSCP